MLPSLNLLCAVLYHYKLFLILSVGTINEASRLNKKVKDILAQLKATTHDLKVRGLEEETYANEQTALSKAKQISETHISYTI